MPRYHQSELVRSFFLKGQPMSFGKGDVILGNDAVTNGVYYIDTGYIKAYSISDKGDELIHLIFGHGEIFPMTWAYLGIEPDQLFFESIADSVVWRVARESFTKFIQADIKLSHAMAVQMANQFQVYADRLDNLEYKKASERVAYRLLFLASRFGEKQDGTVLINAPITHELFANSVNLARESVSREMEKLDKLGLIKHNGSRIVIKDVEGLAKTLTRPISLRNWNLTVGKLLGLFIAFGLWMTQSNNFA